MRGAIVGAIAGLALFIIVFSLSDLEMGFGRASFSPIHLVFASAVILLSAYLFSRRKKPESANKSTQKSPETVQSSNYIVLLMAIALVSSSVLIFAMGHIYVTVFNVYPIDWISRAFTITAIGFFVGALVTVILAIAWRLK
jgi:FtsH-binding integral membrane protein